MLMLAIDKRLPLSAKATGSVLVDHFNVETRLCFPSIKLMAAETMLDESTIKRAIRRLKKAGWIDWKKKGRSYHYTINWEQSQQLFEARQQRIDRHHDTYNSEQIGGNAATYEEEDGSDIGGNSAAKGGNAAPNRWHSCAPLTLEDNPRKIIHRDSKNFPEEETTNNDGVHPSGGEPDRDSKVARQKGARIQVSNRLEAVRECRRKLTNLGYGDAKDLVQSLPIEVATAATNAEMDNFGKGVGAGLIVEWIEAERGVPRDRRSSGMNGTG